MKVAGVIVEEENPQQNRSPNSFKKEKERERGEAGAEKGVFTSRRV